MTDAQFWGLIVTIVGLALSIAGLIGKQGRRIDAIKKEADSDLKANRERIEEVNRSMHYATAEIREEINNRDGKAHTRITQVQVDAEKRYATKDGTEKALDRISAEIKAVGKDLKGEITKLRDRQETGRGDGQQ